MYVAQGHLRFRTPRGADPTRGCRSSGLAAEPDILLLSGHSLDSSHQRMPWRICSDNDKLVRAAIDRSRSRSSGSIMNVKRCFLIIALASCAGHGQTRHENGAPFDDRSAHVAPAVISVN